MSNTERTPTPMNSKDYKAIAKKLGVRHLYGRWGISFWVALPGSRHKLVQFTPLDGWVTDPKEVERIMRERGMEL